jgi:hypothetical protein
MRGLVQYGMCVRLTLLGHYLHTGLAREVNQ